MFPEEKGTCSEEQCTFLGKRPKFHKETCVPNLFAIIIIFVHFYVNLQPILGKVAKKPTIS
jgi:hypothetical protein